MNTLWIQKLSAPAITLLLGGSCFGVHISLLAAEPPKTPPDLTQDRTVDRKLTYNISTPIASASRRRSSTARRFIGSPA